ncbi:hypothetical protein Fraau_1481 [Frateuria aurantia DSM 6220]|uniref:Lipoprotein n=1 Tax=Frateuria aurantia (strain ATCC 33424 / DSM 6220 / KCTC 2777 / LMG 1558 / NBRC 3245 / NCIMB 13370) TaxID=767434 RepID=H8L659_FRAAD|nr:hypothetical protein Fraau_1481 [Frateuria aurantia DSM 6220]
MLRVLRMTTLLLMLLPLGACKTLTKSSSEPSPQQTQNLIQVRTIKPTVLCDMGDLQSDPLPNYPALPGMVPLAADKARDVWAIGVAGQYGQLAIRYNAILSCLAGYRQRGLIN